MEVIGLFYIFLLFAACLAAVLVVKLAWMGFKSSREGHGDGELKEEQPEAKEPPKPQPVYYIVEKKRAKKASYSSPREIKFTDEK